MDPSGELTTTPENPYVGPRPYTRQEEKLFFGRERESRDLLSLVISERLLLFYAQSGAGKSSLINTRLVPGLESRNFEVLPVGRVSGELPPGYQVDNIFALNLMIKLDMGEDDPARFSHLRLADFLLNLTFSGEAFYYRPPAAPAAPPDLSPQPPPPGEEIEILPRALIIDQFEELFTTHPEAWRAREDFLRQLAEAMEADPYLWVVLAMREDHIAELDPYASLLPDGLRVRYSMQRMKVAAAKEAITRPVELLRPFEPAAADELADNLSRISAGKDEQGKLRFVDGEYIEPVQLQVVCYQLWEDLKNQPGEQITLEDLQRLARGQDLAQFVNQALAKFYEDTLKKSIHQPGIRVNESKLRDWFSTHLITEASTRGFIYRGEQLTAGIPNPVVDFLEGKLLRGETRAGGRWYELVHDRFIDPILQSNRQWLHARQRRILVRGVGSLIAVLAVSICLFIGFTSFYIPTTVQGQATRAYQTLEGTLAVAQEDAAVAQEDAAVAQQDATQAALLQETSNAQATLDIAVWQDTSKDLLTATSAAGTLEAVSLEATNQAYQAQLQVLLTPVIPTPLANITQIAGLPTPTLAATELPPVPTSIGATPPPSPTRSAARPSPTVNTEELSRQATANAVLEELLNLNRTQTAQACGIGCTSRGTPIHVTQIGTGEHDIVLIGGLTGGYANSSTELARVIRDFYQINVHLIPKDVKLHIITNVNPDSPSSPGTIAGRLNPNRVDINRNWGCNWKEDATFSGYEVNGGSEPFSEPETQSVRDYILLVQPAAVIIWDATYSEEGRVIPGACGSATRSKAFPLRGFYAHETAYIQASPANQDTGDAVNWLDNQGIPAVRVQLPFHDFELVTRDLLKIHQTANINAVRLIMESIQDIIP